MHAKALPPVSQNALEPGRSHRPGFATPVCYTKHKTQSPCAVPRPLKGKKKEKKNGYLGKKAN